MGAPINLTGIGPNQAPGIYEQLLFAQGQPSNGNTKYAALILANITSQGSAYAGIDGYQVYGPDTLVTMQSVNDAINLFGAGSPAHLMVAQFFSVNQSTPLYVIPVPEATSGVAASLAITITVSAGQTSGVLRFQIDQKNPVDTVFAATDTASVIATNVAAQINGNVNLPVTATAASGTVTVTAKVKGARGNFLCAVTKVVSGSGVSTNVTSPTFFTSGAGSDAAGYTAVLNSLALNELRYYYYIPEAGFDSVDGTANTIAAKIQSQIDTMSAPSVGVRQRAVMGSVDTLANTETVATAINDARLEVIWCKNLDLTPAEFAAIWAANIMLFETPFLSPDGVNFDAFGSDPESQDFWNVRAPLDGSAPSSSDIQSAIVNGVTPLRCLRGGRTNVVKRVTSRFQETVGGSPVLDLRITDAGKVTICDYFLDDLRALLGLRYYRCVVVNDPPQGSPPPSGRVVCPSQVRNTVVELIEQYAAANLINGVATQQGLVVQRESNPTSRISIQVPIYTNDPLHTIVVLGLQVS